MAIHTNLDANVAHHGDQYHHDVVVGVECPFPVVKAQIRGVVYPPQMHRQMFPDTSAVGQTAGTELCLLAPDPVPDSARLHRRHLRVELRFYSVLSAGDEPTGCQ